MVTSDPLRRTTDNLSEQLLRRVPEEWHTAHQELIQDDAHGPPVYCRSIQHLLKDLYREGGVRGAKAQVPLADMRVSFISTVCVLGDFSAKCPAFVICVGQYKDTYILKQQCLGNI